MLGWITIYLEQTFVGGNEDDFNKCTSQFAKGTITNCINWFSLSVTTNVNNKDAIVSTGMNSPHKGYG